MNRRSLIKQFAAAGILSMAADSAPAASSAGTRAASASERRRSRMKITAAESIMSGSDVFVRIETDAGIVGYGDATNHFLPYSAEGTLKDLFPLLLGEDPERIEYLWQSCLRRRFMRGGPATGTAIAGIDQALWDIKGKAYGVPVYQLLGGLARTRVRLYGAVSGNTAAEAARQAKERAAKGITAIRFRAFHSYDAQELHDHRLAVEQQIEYLAAIREAVGEKVDLILECHGRYDPEWAVELTRRAESYRPFLIEDPIRHENPQAMAQVRAKSYLPLATGERYHSKWEFRETIANRYVDYVRPDVCHCGGISEMKKIAAFAEVYELNLIPHNNAGPLGTAATLHAALAIPNLIMIEAPWVNGDAKTDVVSPYPTVVNGYALPLEGPGLGVEFDEALAKTRPYKRPPLQKVNALDGSVRDF
ncbi:MAG: mandelate racemase/muconate lactonizing enzyme family protein [bacterium]|nr:mandelate racemase/muconate lactonizing enzyme family protein [bacterium]